MRGKAMHLKWKVRMKTVEQARQGAAESKRGKEEAGSELGTALSARVF
jgi:hypothetical protein